MNYLVFEVSGPVWLKMVYLSMSWSLVGVGGSWPACGVAQPIWFLLNFLNQILKVMTMLSDDVGT
jgi:hypothetical protein